MLPKDYVLAHLVGAAVSDPLSNIGIVGPDLTHAAPLLAVVEGAAARLVPLAAPVEAVGRLGPGPLAGVPVAAGTMDAWAALVGCGGAREGAQVWLSGTSEVPGAVARGVVPTPGVVVFPEAMGVRMHAAPTQAGGDAAAWAAALLNVPVEALSALAGGPRGPDVPLFLPQLAGERAPLWDPGLRGAFLGLTRRAGPGDLARAVFEGVALSARHAMATVRASAAVTPDVLWCGGGGFRSPEWARIRADVMGTPLRVMESEPGVTGAALIAAVAAGEHPTLAEAWDATARFGPEIAPDPRAAAFYDGLFAVYTDAITTADAVTRRISAL
jgi:xylulokinase